MIDLRLESHRLKGVAEYSLKEVFKEVSEIADESIGLLETSIGQLGL